MAGKKITPLAERFAKFVHQVGPDECWLWMGSMCHKYGQVSTGKHGKAMLAHRAAWIIAHDSIPAGLQVLHRCDNPRCVNIAHLFLGTQRDNMHDMIAKGRDGFRGERHGAAKLTEAIVREIRTSPDTGRALAKRFGVPFQTISNVRRRKSWKHVI
jgi:Autographiviridae endonuclease